MDNEQKHRFDGEDDAHPGDLAKFYRQNFNTLLGHEDEWRFQVWMDEAGLSDMLDDYDLRGVFKDDPARSDHWPAEYRKPNHLLFDSTSRYHGTPDVGRGGEYVGGTWSVSDEGRMIFTPSDHMLATTHPANWLAATMRTDYPEVILCLPKECQDER